MGQVIDRDLYCTVVSIVPFAIKEMKPGLSPNIYEIEAASEEDPQVLHIGTGSHNVYINEDQGSLNVRDTSTEIARSVVEDFCTSQLEYGEGTGPGLFWVIGKLTVDDIRRECKAELLQAKIRQRRWFTKLVEIADRDWEQYHKPNVISGFQRLAAKILKVDPTRHTWLEPNVHTGIDLVNCKACTSPIRPEAIICPVCRAVLNPVKFKELQFATV